MARPRKRRAQAAALGESRREAARNRVPSPQRADLPRLYELLTRLDDPNAPEDERAAILSEAITAAGEDAYAMNLVRPYLPAKLPTG